MLYGEEKRRHMARSIFRPTSSSRKRRILNKQTRQKVRGELRKDYDDFCVPDRDFGWWSDRQSLSSGFVRWATETTKPLPQEMRLSHLRGMLVKTEVTSLALDRLKHWSDFEENPGFQGERATPDWEQQRKERHERRIRLLNEIVKGGGHGPLNRYMAQHHKTVVWVVEYPRMRAGTQTERVRTERVGPEAPRLLRGLGDIPLFLDDLLRASLYSRVRVKPYIERSSRGFEWERSTRENPEHHPEWMNAMGEFLDLWETNHGNISELKRLVM